LLSSFFEVAASRSAEKASLLDANLGVRLMAKLLVVDDEKNIRASLVKFLESTGHQVQSAESGPKALAVLEGGRDFDLVLTDYQMAELNGLELLKQIKRHHPDTLVILMTAFGTIHDAVSSIRAGAYDYVTKPFSLQQIQHLLDRALEVKNLRLKNRELRSAIDGVPVLDTRSPRMVALFEMARQAAESDATILLSGESGTGKNVLAKQIHGWSLRRERPFVVVNCTTLSEHLLESELFGHMRGAFTGAVKDKPGRLEAADCGTVFLDEVADLTPPLQTKFLRFLQEQRFERLGGQQTITVDTRIIAASNRDLQNEVSAGRFRADLFYRLNVIPLRVPALRERSEDIPALAEWFLSSAIVRNRRPGLELSPEASEALIAYSWPGNVRELRNVIERASVLSRDNVIDRDDLPDTIFLCLPSPPLTSAKGATLDDVVDEVEADHIRRVLSTAVSVDEAADTLGISLPTLWRKRRRYRID
jgi:two-component system, NtrC family, response regulator AlgB